VGLPRCSERWPAQDRAVRHRHETPENQRCNDVPT
jgi:hypothetical protein